MKFEFCNIELLEKERERATLLTRGRRNDKLQRETIFKSESNFEF